jgi:hypothetical protein
MPTATVRLAPLPAATHELHAALAEVDQRLGTGVAYQPNSEPPPAVIPPAAPPWTKPWGSAASRGGASARSTAPRAPARPPSPSR